MANRQLIFIDDSGDPGFKESSSKFFVMTAVIFDDSEVVSGLSITINQYRHSMTWRKNREFKFSKDRKDVIIGLLKLASEYNYAVYAIYINKLKIKNYASIIDSSKLYNWAIGELLKKIPIGNAKIKIDGRSSKNNMSKTRTYLRHVLEKGAAAKIDIQFEDSTANNLIQFADLIADSINRFLNKNKTDADLYFKIIKNKLEMLEEVSG